MLELIKKNIKYIFIGLWFILYPLMMTNGYFNVSTTKTITFMLITLMAFAFYAWNDFSDWIIKNNGLIKIDKDFCMQKWRNMSFSKKCGSIFLLSCFTSFIFAKNKLVAFTGSTDSYTGLFLMIIMAIAYWAVANHITFDEKIAKIMAVGADIVIIFAVCQFMGADLFGLLAALNTDYNRVYNFLSTMGNTNLYGLYVCAVTPIVMSAYILSRDIKSRCFFGVSAGIGIWGILVANTDASYIGLIVMLMMITVVFSSEKKCFLRALDLGAIISFSVLLIKFIYGLCGNARGRSSITRLIMNQSVVVFIALTAVFILIRILLDKFVYKNIVYKFVNIAICLIWIICIAAFIVLFIYFSVINREAAFYGLEEILRFDKKWGTDRGYVWTWLWTLFSDAGILQKLFGAGQGSVAIILSERFGKEMFVGLGYYFENAHCAYLHILTTLGLFGLVSYVFFLLSSIVRAFKAKDYRIAVAVTLLVYACVDVVTVTRPNTIVLLTLLLALCQKEQTFNK